MQALRLLNVWSRWGLIPRLMAAVGFAILVGGIIQNYLLAVEGAAEHSARHEREVKETLHFLAPLVADQAVLGDYAAIGQLLNAQAKKLEILELTWTDKNGRTLTGKDAPDKREAPSWFTTIVPIDRVDATLDVTTGGASYGTLRGVMNSIPASNRLWSQFVHQLQIVLATLLLMLQIIWLIFRGNLGTLRMLAVSANRFSQGDHAVRVEATGAPEVRSAAEAFNNMANNIESLIASLGESEANNRRLAAIVKQSSEAIWTRDLDGRITTWNAGATLLFGYSADEAIGHSLTLDRTSVEEMQRRLSRLKAGETFSYETKAVTKSGRELDIEVAAAPLHDENSRVVGKICVAHDVTQRKRAEEELYAAREAAEAANQAKSTFLAKMSHEIRTPMNGVLGMTELLLETGLTGAQRRFAETVQRSGKSLLGIINDILDFSKIEAGKLNLEHIDFDLRQTVEDTVELLAERAQSKGLEVVCALPVNLVPRVKGDPLRLGQVLTNLVGNAIKFTDRGEVTVSASCLEDTPDSVALRFEVTDTGPGISKEAQGRIFENFTQADGSTTRSHGGTGLGLPISKQLVEMMGGTMHVESVPGVGSTFWFAVRFEKHDAEHEGEVISYNKLEGIRALVVAPNATTRNILHVQMTNWGMSNRTVETPDQALDMLTQASGRGAPYDVVIIDTALEGSGALKLAKAIKASPALADARTIMLMPVGRQGDIREVRHAGVRMCLSKPVRQSALYDCLVSVMSRSEDSSANVPVAEAPPAPVRRHNRRRLLLAEDNPVNQEVALGILQIEGYQVNVAKNGAEAVEAFSKSAFDLVLMDCHMPEMDGFEATRKIREMEKQGNLKRIPIVALTANAMQQDREECLNAGMDDHLSKPYSRLQMRETLDRWLPADTVEEVAPKKTENTHAKGGGKVISILDRTAVDGLRALQTSDNPDLFTRIIDAYLDDTPKVLEQMRQAVDGDDMFEIAKAAHTLKSSSANVGAVEFADRCKQLEALARRGSVGMVRELLGDLRAAYASVESALRVERGPQQSTKGDGGVSLVQAR
jgi:two-component system sensor histidine kinase/response regulator